MPFPPPRAAAATASSPAPHQVAPPLPCVSLSPRAATVAALSPLAPPPPVAPAPSLFPPGHLHLMHHFTPHQSTIAITTTILRHPNPTSPSTGAVTISSLPFPPSFSSSLSFLFPFLENPDATFPFPRTCCSTPPPPAAYGRHHTTFLHLPFLRLHHLSFVISPSDRHYLRLSPLFSFLLFIFPFFTFPLVLVARRHQQTPHPSLCVLARCPKPHHQQPPAASPPPLISMISFPSFPSLISDFWNLS